jgi:NDP-sugar pyrophosphorylase family protein
LLDSLIHAGVNEVILVAHHLYEQIELYAQAWSACHQQSVRVIHQPHLFGTAHALQEVIEQDPHFVSQSFVLSATDYLVPREFFADLLEFHASHESEISVSMKSLSESEMAGRSSIRFLHDDRIVEIVEKPESGTAPSTFGANLTFVLPPSIVPYLDEVPISSRGEREVQQAINTWLQQGGHAQGLLQPTPREWTAPA